MSLLQSGPYRSRVLRSMIRQTQRWVDRGRQTLRHLQIAASWSAQIVLYPIYAAFQTARLIGAQLQQVVLTLQSQPDPVPTSAPITVSTPVQQALLTVEQFATVGLPVWQEPDSVTSAAPVQTGTSWLQQSISATRYWVRTIVLKLTGSVQPVNSFVDLADFAGVPAAPLHPATFIRGIASCVETRSIVLVTNHNQVLDRLTPQQQAHLRQRITWNVAHYSRYRQLRQQTQRFRLSDTAERAIVLSPIRVLVRWAQRLRLQRLDAVFASRFAPMVTVRRLEGSNRPQLAAANALAAEVPLQNVLQLVQQFSLPEGMQFAAALQPAAGSLSLAGSAAIEPAPIDPSQEDSLVAGGTALNRRSAVVIQGIASDVSTRSIVLVTAQNQSLDVLTPQQQAQLRQRIAWEGACYGRSLRLRQAVRHVLSRLQPPQSQAVLPPIRAFWQLMAWVQSGSVAIAANLFHEAALVPLPAADFSLNLEPSLTVRLPAPHPWSQLLNQVTKRDRPPQARRPAPSQPARSRLPVLTASNFPQLPRPSSLLHQLRGLISPLLAAPQPNSPISTPSLTSSPLTTPLTSYSPPSPTHSPSYIETNAVPIGYEQSLLERVLRWLDRLFLWFEEAIGRLWQWVRSLKIR